MVNVTKIIGVAIGKIGQKAFHTNPTSAASKKIFSFAQKHPLYKLNGELSEDGLILTHLTDYVPSQGYIDTARSAVRACRDSVHFAVNHAVTPHEFGSWNDKKYAVLIPMGTALKTKGNKFAGGVAADFYSKGKVKIPKGSVIVRRSKNLAEGSYRITDASKIEEFKNLHGVKIIDTSADDMKTAVDDIIPKLGYQLKGTEHVQCWGKINEEAAFSDFKRFNKLLSDLGMKPMLHSHSPNGKTEMLISNIQYRAALNKGWIVEKNGKIIVDYKREYLDALEYIDEFAAKSGMPKDFDTNAIREVINSAKTPQEAVELLKSKMNILSSMLIPEQVDLAKSLNLLDQEVSLYCTFSIFSNRNFAEFNERGLLEYLRNPSKQRFDAMYASSKTAEEFLSDWNTKLMERFKPLMDDIA